MCGSLATKLESLSKFFQNLIKKFMNQIYQILPLRHMKPVDNIVLSCCTCNVRGRCNLTGAYDWLVTLPLLPL